MTSVFDGVSTALNDVFGAMVVHVPPGGEATDIRAVFRKEPISLQDDDGRDVLVLAPTLKVNRPLPVEITRGDSIIVPGGQEYLVVANSSFSSNPSRDAFEIFELEKALS